MANSKIGITVSEKNCTSNYERGTFNSTDKRMKNTAHIKVKSHRGRQYNQ